MYYSYTDRAYLPDSPDELTDEDYLSYPDLTSAKAD
jgi:hypothetical protein